MNIKAIFNNDDDRAVSPVIGVILMVAITVILAAVIGTFVLGLGDSLGDGAPNAQIQSEINTNDGTIVFNHVSGDNIDEDNLRVNGDDDHFDEDLDEIDFELDGDFSAGDSITLNEGGGDFETDGDETVSLVWDGDGSSSVLQSQDYGWDEEV